MAYFTDENGNLYDENQNLVAQAGTYSVDENGNVQFLQQEVYQEPVQETYSQSYQESLAQVQIEQGREVGFFERVFNDISGLFKKKEFSGEEAVVPAVAVHKNQNGDDTKYEDKFPSELTPEEDLRRFLHRVQNVGDFFKGESGKEDNVSRFKLMLIGKSDIVDFLDQLSTLLNAGIRLVDAVKILKSQSKNTSMKLLLGSLAHKMGNGKHLSEALEDYSYIFPVKWIKLILAAEKSGKMAEVLNDLSEEEKNQMQFVSKVKGAMIYPGILITMAVAVFWLMMTKMVPALEKSFGSTEKFPTLTIKIIEASHYMQENFLLILLIPAFVIAFLVILNSQFVTIQLITNWIGLNVPVFGKISFRKNLIIFADNFSLLLSSGVLVSDSLKIVAQVMPSIRFRRELHRIRHGVENGKSISQIMGLFSNEAETKENPYFPLEVAQMMKIGEETGNTIEILKKIREVNATKLDNMVKNLTSMLEPIITIVIGLIVGTLLIAFMLPMMSSFKAV